ncbi:hypothetical protein GCM10027181_24030 [Rheinheimera gaetbuli]
MVLFDLWQQSAVHDDKVNISQLNETAVKPSRVEPESSSSLPSMLEQELTIKPSHNINEKQIEFIVRFSDITLERDIYEVAKSALDIFDTNNDKVISEHEAPFLIFLANKFIPIENESITLHSKEYQDVAQLLRGKTDDDIAHSYALSQAQQELYRLNQVIEEEIASHIFKEIDISQLEQTLQIAFHWSDLDFDGELTEASDMPFLAVAHDFIHREAEQKVSQHE